MNPEHIFATKLEWWILEKFMSEEGLNGLTVIRYKDVVRLYVNGELAAIIGDSFMGINKALTKEEIKKLHELSTKKLVPLHETNYMIFP